MIVALQNHENAFEDVGRRYSDRTEALLSASVSSIDAVEYECTASHFRGLVVSLRDFSVSINAGQKSLLRAETIIH